MFQVKLEPLPENVEKELPTEIRTLRAFYFKKTLEVMPMK
jgi:hypothetical protein